MAMIKKSITVTEKQDDWIKAKIETGYYGNESEIVRELIRERQIREEETPEQIEYIRQKLIAAEKSVKKHGYSKKTMTQILDEAKQKYTKKHG